MKVAVSTHTGASAMTPELRELLELSAKAMGHDPVEVRRCKIRGEYLYCHSNEQGSIDWQPHRDRLQCFNMECALGIRIEWDKTTRPGVMASHEYGDELGCVSVAAELFEWHDNDRAKARMMASLRVAAESRRRMQEQEPAK